MPFKSKKQKQINSKKYYSINREDILKHKGRYYLEEKVQLLKRIDEKFGISCFLCDSDRFLIMHEINFVKHKKITNILQAYRWYLKHNKRFIRLCWQCHMTLHRLHKDKNLLEMALW